MAQKTTKGKKKEKIITPSGRVYITAGMNNTIITVTDSEGNTLFTASSGSAGFKGSRKSTPYAATVTTETVLKRAANDFSMRKAVVFMKGIGPGREAALRAIKGSSVDIDSIIDVTPIPHNGVRPPKVRRV